jgi:hypothetical protein
MAQNNQAVAYGFGQNGSAFIDDHETVFYPPHGLVVVAIQMVNNAKFTYLEAEMKSIPTYGGSSTHIHGVTPEYFGHAVAAHDLGDCMIVGASKPTASTTVTHVANTAGYNGASAIKVGMQVVSVETAATNDFPRDGLLGKPIIIEEILSTTTFRVSDNALGAILNPAQSLSGLQLHSSGYGGKATTNVDSFPAGMTVFGRWVKIQLAYDTHGTGKVILYFGK